MCTIFKSAIRRVLPQATVVVDHFHLVQLANQTLTEVRRRSPRPARPQGQPNRVIKAIARDAYGFRKPGNQRLRTAARPPVEPVDTSMPANFVEPAPCHRVGWRHRTVSTAGIRFAVAGS